MDSQFEQFSGNTYIQFLTQKKYRIYRHLVSLLLLVGLLLLSTTADSADFFQPLSKYVTLVFLLSLVYVNMYVLVPVYLLKNRQLHYISSILFYIALSFLAHYLISRMNYISPHKRIRVEQMNKYRYLRGMVVFTFIMLISVGASTAIKLFQRWVTDSERINELERTTIIAELEQLKNQINPHFLFNMLNNANVLTQQDPEKASQLLMKLSDLLRYQLYDSSRSAVLLTSDINFLTDFLNLEKTRRDNFEYSITTTGDLNGVQIPPLLFITFVENAVKHNVDGAHSSYVHLYFNVQDTQLHFKCVNSKPDTIVLKNGFGGLGLTNIKRRLHLLYDEKHILDIREEKSLFTVFLTLQL